jgi:hypothetical protein
MAKDATTEADAVEPTVITITEGEQATELIADAIEQIADAAESLRHTGLSDRALVVLLQDAIGPARITRTAIRDVLDALPRLREYLDD